VDQDASVVGVTFEKGDLTLSVDSSQMPFTMMINSSKLKASGYKLLEIFSSELDATATVRSRAARGYGSLGSRVPTDLHHRWIGVLLHV